MTNQNSMVRSGSLWRRTSLGLILLIAVLTHTGELAAQVHLGVRLAASPVVTLNGPAGTICKVQWSDDLANPARWFHLGYCILTNSQLEVADPEGTNRARSFYRVLEVPETTMAFIPGGDFLMGNAFADLPSENELDEVPVHSVHVSAFCMDRCEVTKALWDEVLGWATNHGYAFDYAGQGKGPNHPVHSVSWHDAVKWCNARSEWEGFSPCYYADTNLAVVFRTGSTSAPPVVWSANGYRLPTEAEWEKAARGGTAGLRFPWNDSDNITHSNANYYSQLSTQYPYDTSPTRGYNPSYKTGSMPYTSPVGAFAANGYGLYDMPGNVAEWCWDVYEEHWYTNAAATLPDSQGPQSGSSTRVVRGGSWNDRANYLRCADRFNESQSTALTPLGFRCVRRP